MDTLDYKFTLKWMPGKCMAIADALGRSPLPGTQWSICNDPVQSMVHSVPSLQRCFNLVMGEEDVLQLDPAFQSMFAAASADQEYLKIVAEVQKGTEKS